jgi:hypothetical protein
VAFFGKRREVRQVVLGDRLFEGYGGVWTTSDMDLGGGFRAAVSVPEVDGSIDEDRWRKLLDDWPDLRASLDTVVQELHSNYTGAGPNADLWSEARDVEVSVSGLGEYQVDVGGFAWQSRGDGHSMTFSFEGLTCTGASIDG